MNSISRCGQYRVGSASAVTEGHCCGCVHQAASSEQHVQLIGRKCSRSNSDSYTRGTNPLRNECAVFTAWLELLMLHVETAGCVCIAARPGVATLCTYKSKVFLLVMFTGKEFTAQMGRDRCRGTCVQQLL